MRFVSTTLLRFSLTILTIGFTLLQTNAQENSPFTRYGLGESFNSLHAINRAMGGLSAAYSDGINNNVGQAVNFMNPATYSNYFMVSYDLGLTIDTRNLRSENPSGKFRSNYFYPSYIAVGMPLKRTKGLGMAFGIRPVTRINYSVVNRERVAGDSLATIYEGSGGLNQAFLGLGKKWKNLSIGFNTGFNFGRREISTKKIFLNDTAFFFQSNSSTITTFNKVFLNTGFQYEFLLKKQIDQKTNVTNNYFLRLGGTYSLNQNMSASQDQKRETYTETQAGDITIDTVSVLNNIKGTIVLPSTYAAGITIHKTSSNNRGTFEMWSIGAEYTTTQWSRYRFYNQADQLVNSWQLKIGAQLAPDPLNGRNYWSNVNYRVGAFIGKEYIDPDGNGLKTTGFSLGAGFPIKKWNNYDRQFTILNTALQFGKRGSGVNNITESYAQFTFGISLTDIWFQKRRYD